MDIKRTRIDGSLSNQDEQPKSREAEQLKVRKRLLNMILRNEVDRKREQKSNRSV